MFEERREGRERQRLTSLDKVRDRLGFPPGRLRVHLNFAIRVSMLCETYHKEWKKVTKYV